MSPVFTPADVWHGGYYELYIELRSPCTEQLNAVLEALWSHPALEGCYLSHDDEPVRQERIQPGARKDVDRLYGTAELPNGVRVACGTFPFNPLNDDEDEPTACAQTLFIPMGTLSRAYPVGG